MFLCISMLIGTTYAWFSDSVTSNGNVITSGTLNIDLGLKKDAADDYVSLKQNPDTKAFDYELWEPGYVDYAFLRVSTTGNLALKYTLRIVANGAVTDLSDVIDVYYAEGEVAATRTLDGMTNLGSLTQALAGQIDFNGDGTLIPGNPDADGITALRYFTLALKMREDAGNDYQDKAIGANFSIQLIAAQLTHETDSIDDQYDVSAESPAVVQATVTDATAELTVEDAASGVSVTVPADDTAEGDTYTLVVENDNVVTDDATGESTVAFEATLYKNNVEVTNGTTIYEINYVIGANLNVTSVKHNGVAMTEADTGADQTYKYEGDTLTIYTSSFSPFEISVSRSVIAAFSQIPTLSYNTTGVLRYELYDNGTKLTAKADYNAQKANWALSVADADIISVTMGPTAYAGYVSYTLKGLKAGTTTVTLTAQDFPAYKIEQEITVGHKLELVYANTALANSQLGAMVELGAVAISSLKLDGVEVEDRSLYTFECEDTEIATVTSDAITPVSAGTTYINVTLTSDPSVTLRKYLKFVNAAASLNGTLYAKLGDAMKAAASGDTVVLMNDITESVAFSGVSGQRFDGYELTLDLNGHTITGEANREYALRAEYGIITIDDTVGNGGIHYGKDFAIIVDHLAGEYTSKVIIKHGNFTGKTSVIQCGTAGGTGSNKKYYGGELEILGGVFTAVPDTNENYDANGNFRYLLNKLDYNPSSYPGGMYSPSVITVKGGSFYMFDPSDNAAEGAGTNFVANGFTVNAGADGWFTVIPE